MSKFMKVLGLIIQPVIGLLSGNSVPGTINVNGQTYCSGFYEGVLYSTYVTSADDVIKKEGDLYYYKVPTGDFTFVTTENNHGISDTTLYVSESSMENAKKYFKDNSCYTYHCRVSMADNTSSDLTFQNADGNMFNEFIAFCEKNSYKPFGTKPEKNPLCKALPLPDEKDPEYALYKKTKDGLFISSKGNTIRAVNGVLYLVYQYDFDHGGSGAKMWGIELPEKLNSYFKGLLSK